MCHTKKSGCLDGVNISGDNFASETESSWEKSFNRIRKHKSGKNLTGKLLTTTWIKMWYHQSTLRAFTVTLSHVKLWASV